MGVHSERILSVRALDCLGLASATIPSCYSTSTPCARLLMNYSPLAPAPLSREGPEGFEDVHGCWCGKCARDAIRPIEKTK